ncbi:uncharacterized protein LOC128244850 [Mya arenaria]|uniref:uncharacterized protein LOC128244850 n=1 Tax=Mya arenaria TaxID=6604 RepID=UPI0022E5E498|nr:uncharacterized protein LOC128244850 [Mya arenaria]
MANMDEFEKDFAGEWKWESEENVDELCKHMELCEEDKKMMTSMHPSMIIKRCGDSYDLTYKDANFSFSSTVTFGVPYEAKAPNDPPFFHNIITSTFENGVLHDVSVSKLTGEKKRDFELESKNVDGKLVVHEWKKGDPSVKARRTYVRV